MRVVRVLLRWLLGAGLAGAAVLAVLVVTGRVPLFGHATSHDEGPSAAAPAEQPPVAVTVAEVTPRRVQRRVQVVGSLYGYDEVLITPKVEGRVARVRHDVGDVVRPGEVLLEVEDVDHKLALAESQRALELELAKLGLKEMPPADFDVRRHPTVVRADAVEKNAGLKVERMRRAGASTRAEEIDQAEADLKVAKATYQQTVLEAQTALASARHRHALLETARQRLADTKVAVPTPSGGAADDPAEYVVSQRMVSEGEMVRAFPSVAAFKIVRDKRLKLQATVPERYVGEVKVGQPVAVRVEAYPDESFPGSVSRVNPTVDRANRTFQSEVLVPHGERRLRAGSFVKASVLTREDDQAATVPEEALVTFAGVTKVFVVRDGTSRPVPVRPGLRVEVKNGDRAESWAEVAGDIPAGARVVTSGHSQLADGTPVRIR